MIQVNPQVMALLHIVYVNIVKHESRHVDTMFSGEGDGTTLLSIDCYVRAASPPPDVNEVMLHTKVCILWLLSLVINAYVISIQC